MEWWSNVEEAPVPFVWRNPAYAGEYWSIPPTPRLRWTKGVMEI